MQTPRVASPVTSPLTDYKELRTTPIPFWLVCFSQDVKEPVHQMWFVVVLPNGTVIEPRVDKRL